jgi:ATP-dependent DNA helicase RecQ
VIRIDGEGTEVNLDRGKITALQKQHPEALKSVRKIARFLCGLSSPSFTQAKLHKHADFGSLAEVPFHRVIAKLENNPIERSGH